MMTYQLDRAVYDASICEHEYAAQRHDCWHGPCRVTVVFREGSGVLVENRYGHVRRLAPNLVSTTDLRTPERKEAALGDPRPR